jgi:hypothetical protein
MRISKMLIATSLAISAVGGASATMQKQIDYRVLYYDNYTGTSSDEIIGGTNYFCDGTAQSYGRVGPHSTTEHYGC